MFIVDPQSLMTQIFSRKQIPVCTLKNGLFLSPTVNFFVSLCPSLPPSAILHA